MTRSTIGCLTAMLLLLPSLAVAQQAYEGTALITGKDVAQSLLFLNGEPYKVETTGPVVTLFEGAPLDLASLATPDPSAPGGLGIARRANYQAQLVDSVLTLTSLEIAEYQD